MNLDISIILKFDFFKHINTFILFHCGLKVNILQKK